MKKRIFLAFLLVLLMSVGVASATVPELIVKTTKKDIINALETESGTKAIPKRYIKLVDDYLNAFPQPTPVLKKGLEKALEIKKIWEDIPFDEKSDMPDDVRASLQYEMVKFAEIFGAEMSYSGTATYVTAPNGRRFALFGENTSPIKQTGNGRNYTLTYAVLGGLALLVALLAVYQIKQIKRKDAVS